MQSDPLLDFFPKIEGKHASRGIAVSVIFAQLLTIVFSIGIIFHTSKFLSVFVITFSSVYFFHLSWIRGVKYSNFIFKTSVLVILSCNMSFALYFIYKMSGRN